MRLNHSRSFGRRWSFQRELTSSTTTVFREPFRSSVSRDVFNLRKQWRKWKWKWKWKRKWQRKWKRQRKWRKHMYTSRGQRCTRTMLLGSERGRHGYV